MVENTKHVVRFLQKHIQKIGQNADLNRNKKIWKKVVLKKKCGSYIRIIAQQSTDQKSIFRKKRQRKGIFIMADKMIENNQVVIMGEIVSPFTFSHQVFGEGFYTMELLVRRLSDSEDRIPVMVSERLLDITQDYTGQYIEIHGQFRSYNRHEEKHNRLVLSVFAREVKFVEEDDENVPVNQIFMVGFICKPPVYSNTPLGREIADILLAVNRPYGKSDYIPCICWGRNARYASAFAVGGHVLLWGRIQSREYMKRIGENETEKRVAYEVSVSKLEYME